MESCRKDVTAQMSQRLETYICAADTRIYWAKEVTFDYQTLHPIRVDYMKFVPKNNTISGIEKGDFCCYEIKSCLNDFNSKHGHNFIGDYNYYIMEESLFSVVQSKIPFGVGVLVPDDYASLKSVKNARRVDRTKPMCEMLLMMFRSANRDRRKSYDS